MERISREEVRQILSRLETNRFFRALIQKKDGEIRWMTCRLGVTSYLKGGSAAYDFAAKGMVNVADVDLMRRQKQGDASVKTVYRNINLATVKEVKLAGQHYIVED